MKKYFYFFLGFVMLLAGCTSTKTHIVHNTAPQSVIKEVSNVETRRRSAFAINRLTGYGLVRGESFGWRSGWGFTLGTFVAGTALLATDIITLPIQLLFVRRTDGTYFKVSGQIVDENNHPLPNYEFVIENRLTITDANGFFQRELALQNDRIVFRFFSEHNKFEDSERLLLPEPYKITFYIDNYGNIRAEAKVFSLQNNNFVQIPKGMSLDNDKIVVRQREFFRSR
ncbi:MAG: hypothetical protein FWC85_04960 [Elusimicrobia bacterium]|nr:hypothetical protein [Elusimicrobiota bacterium]